jgi:hypothetical protein
VNLARDPRCIAELLARIASGFGVDQRGAEIVHQADEMMERTCGISRRSRLEHGQARGGGHDSSQRQVSIDARNECRVSGKIGRDRGTHKVPVPSQALQLRAQPLTMSDIELVIV